MACINYYIYHYYKQLLYVYSCVFKINLCNKLLIHTQGQLLLTQYAYMSEMSRYTVLQCSVNNVKNWKKLIWCGIISVNYLKSIYWLIKIIIGEFFVLYMCFYSLLLVCTCMGFNDKKWKPQCSYECRS